MSENGAALPNRVIKFAWPWWSHPVWVIILFPGMISLYAILAGDNAYDSWEVTKYISPDQGGLIALGLLALCLGAVISSARTLGSRIVEVQFDPSLSTLVDKSYKILLILTLAGYTIWIGTAVLNGVGLSNLIDVISLKPGAISALKDDAAPTGGLTTFTQLGPLVAVFAMVRRDLDKSHAALWIVIGLAAFRALFYAERLALIEVAVPIVLYLSIRVGKSGKKSLLARLGPLFAAPAVWALFAALEYTRSWIYYQQFTNAPYFEWVTNRLIGYYTTAVNNSALFDTFYPLPNPSPFYTTRAFWEAPANPFTPTEISGVGVGPWWSALLASYGNPNFNNTGSILIANAELGTLGMVIYWGIIGLAIGAVYASAKSGNLASMLSYTVLFVGFLELPRIIYWAQGRATPLILASFLLIFVFARAKKRRQTQQSEKSARVPQLQSRY